MVTVCDIHPADRAIQTRKPEDMRHPATIWSDPSYADESIDKLRQAYLDWCRGRPQPAAGQTVEKYNKAIQSFIRSLAEHGEEQTLASITPANVSRWISGRRDRGLSDEGNATHLIALKVFTNKFLLKELELTVADLLRKVPRMTPPERPMQILTEAEREQVLNCFDRPNFEDTRNRALIAVYMATGLRFNEVLSLAREDLDIISGVVTVIAKGGKQRPAKIAPRALKMIREYLRVRPKGDSNRLWLTAEGSPLLYGSAQTMFRRLKERCGIPRLRSHLFRHGFAQGALKKGAHAGLVQELLGHSTATMTRRYLGQAKQEEAARQMPDFSPI